MTVLHNLIDTVSSRQIWSAPFRAISTAPAITFLDPGERTKGQSRQWAGSDEWELQQAAVRSPRRLHPLRPPRMSTSAVAGRGRDGNHSEVRKKMEEAAKRISRGRLVLWEASSTVPHHHHDHFHGEQLLAHDRRRGEFTFFHEPRARNPCHYLALGKLG